MRAKTLFIGGALVVAAFLSAPLVGVVGLMALGSSFCAQPVEPTDGTDSALTMEQYFAQFSVVQREEQLTHANLIVQIGVQRGFSSRSIQIAVATAIQESNLLNLDYGDRDSLGLFQQRPSMGWGTREQILNPVYAINTFYDRLEKVEGRDLRLMMEVAIEIQRPNRAAYESRWNWDLVSAQIVNGRTGDPDSIIPDGNIGCSNVGSIGWHLPLDPGVYSIESGFGMRLHPTLGRWIMHDGIDLGAPAGTPIYAAHAGKVTRAGEYGSLGNYVTIDHGGNVETGYGHMSAISLFITEGTFVNAGDIIGAVGTTGRSTGNHLHFSVKVGGQFVDPASFMSSIGLPLTEPASTDQLESVQISSNALPADRFYGSPAGLFHFTCMGLSSPANPCYNETMQVHQANDNELTILDRGYVNVYTGIIFTVAGLAAAFLAPSFTNGGQVQLPIQVFGVIFAFTGIRVLFSTTQRRIVLHRGLPPMVIVERLFTKKQTNKYPNDSKATAVVLYTESPSSPDKLDARARTLVIKREDESHILIDISRKQASDSASLVTEAKRIAEFCGVPLSFEAQAS